MNMAESVEAQKFITLWTILRERSSQWAEEADVVAWFQGGAEGEAHKCQWVREYLKRPEVPVLIVGNNLRVPGMPGAWSLREMAENLSPGEAFMLQYQVVLDECALNTRDQAQDLDTFCTRFGWKRPLIVADSFHAVRAFLTALARGFLGWKGGFFLGCVPVGEGVGAGNFGKWRGELLKVNEYQQQGDVVSIEGGLNYLK